MNMDLSLSNPLIVDTVTLSSKVQQMENLYQGTQKAPGTPGKEEGIQKAATEFEAFLLYYLLKIMRSTLPKGGFLSGGPGEEIFTSLYDEAIAKDMARRGGIGLKFLISPTDK
jgi:flagellar protein FlgJ